MNPVYIAPEVAEVCALHPYLSDAAFRALPIVDQLRKQADRLREGHAAGDTRVRMQVLSWWPGAMGQTLGAVLQGPFNEADALLTVAREHGFPSWDRVEDLGEETPDPGFEQSVETLLNGDLDALARQIAARPELVAERSCYGHGATLLHYLGANGVESHRQRVPLNAADLAALLIARGAQKTATAHMYGGGQTPYDLAVTSAHPARAGISDHLNAVLAPD